VDQKIIKISKMKIQNLGQLNYQTLHDFLEL